METEFTNLGNQAAVYRVDEFDGPYPTTVPAKAKSRFAEEYDVNFHSTRGRLFESNGEHYVIVGVLPDDE